MKEIISTLATERGVSPDTLRKWDERGRVPHRERLPLITTAIERDLALSERDFDFTPKPRRKAESKRKAPKKAKRARAT